MNDGRLDAIVESRMRGNVHVGGRGEETISGMLTWRLAVDPTRDVLRRSSASPFHARYGGEEATIVIASGAVLAGSLPGRALRLVRECWRSIATSWTSIGSAPATTKRPSPLYR
jgi:hypothetical protein